MSLVSRLNKLTSIRNAIILTQRNARLISTSPKKSDTATISTTEKVTQPLSGAKTENKNWVSWGWDYTSEKTDRDYMNSSFFFSVTLCLIFGSFYLAYTPDNLLRDWSQREAFLELRRREAAGLEPISSDYVDPALIELPSEEDLGDTEIII
ncbi:NADH dehydrogenase [ubiquinone] 1 beta subcomplex subunit 11, mitochondrial [Chironomus tepperi]|uniref:NADH dehydrogenase [ubiquinone] 1 beta subcomplex subunit 11, mitochondrial n=1 Tax=Chironomus tepperi TaxID=113505 RepID=UPI00391F190C